MRFSFGQDAAGLRRNESIDVVWDSSRLINGHTLLVGMSGAGKTFLLKQMISGMQSQSPGVRFHVFDVHGDIDIPGASEVKFSEQTPYGLNPLRVNPSPHFGGVRKCIASFMRTINRASSTPLGVKQEAVIRNILLDVYRMRGFNPDNAATWSIDESSDHLVSDGSDNRLYLDIPITEKDDAKAFGVRWDGDRKLWWIATENYDGGITRWLPKTVGRANPSLNDVLIYAQRLLKHSFMGSDQDAITKLEIFSRNAGSYQRKEIDAARNGQKFEDEVATSALDKAKGKAVESYVRFIEAIRTGNEFDDLIKYDSTDVLKSVVDRLEGLKATGIFKSAPAPFDSRSPVWVYKLNPLDRPEKKMFVMFRLQELFYAAIQRGEQTGIKDIFVLDEAQLYVDDDGDGILNILSREARKYGVALLAASQNAAFPDDFISSLATKVVLGIDELYWRQSVAKMRIDPKLLEWIRPHKTMAVQMKERAANKNVWRWVVLPSAVGATSHQNHQNLLQQNLSA